MSWPQAGRCGCQLLVGRRGTCMIRCPYSWGTRNDQTSSLRWKPLHVQFESGQQLDMTTRISCVASLRAARLQRHHHAWPWNKGRSLLDTFFLGPAWHRAGPRPAEHHSICLNQCWFHYSQRSPLILVRSESKSFSQAWQQNQETNKCGKSGNSFFCFHLSYGCFSENQSNRFRIFVSHGRACGLGFSAEWRCCILRPKVLRRYKQIYIRHLSRNVP